MQISDILNKFLNWALPFFAGFFSYLLANKLGERSKKIKLLKAFRLELLINFSLIQDYNKRNFVSKFRALGLMINGFETKVYQKLKDEAILMDLPKNIRFLIIKIYQTISTLQFDYKKELIQPSLIRSSFIENNELSVLKEKIVRVSYFFRKLTFKKRIKGLCSKLKEKVNQKIWL